MERPVLIFLILSMCCGVMAQTTYYVRTDGGDATQCTGMVDAPYPGSGTGQPCAWSHPFWALDASGAWRLMGGDTLIIHGGSYRMGYGGPNLPEDLCSEDYPWGCHLPPLPSGPDPQHPTRILGEGWDGGCPDPPELWGTERAEWILDLTDTSNAVIGCLEITDHSSCAYSHCNQSVACPRSQYPYGDYADVGIEASDSSNVTLQDLNIHGLAAGGIHAGRLTDWTADNVRLAGNGMVGWDGDIGEDSSYSGTIHWTGLTVEWNGCPETYPGLQPDHCWGQETCGGYGDGVGMARSGGHWIIEDSVFRHNVSDGLDLLYVGVDHPDSLVELRRCSAYGNAGNQMKIGGRSRIVNCLAVGNCAFFYQKPFGQEMGALNSGDHCRAGGAALSINLPKGLDSYVVNSTLAGQGWATVEAQCNNYDFPDQPPCDGTERTYLQNSIFRGYQVVYLDYQRLADFVGDGDPYHFTTDETVDNDIVYNCEILSPIGPSVFEQDPLLMNSNIEDLDAHLQEGSPAIDAGLPVGSLGGLVPATDLEGNPRTGPPDLGALEYGGAASCTVTCTATVPSAAQVNTAVYFDGSGTNWGCQDSLHADWDFGDGSTHSDQPAVDHTYLQPGTYTWTLTLSSEDQACTKTGAITITTNPPCSLTCTATASDLAQTNESTLFVGSAQPSGCTGTPAYDWDFGDGTAHSSEASPLHLYAQAGDFTWSFTATLETGSCSESGQIHVVEGPSILNVKKKGNPFRLKLEGSHFQEGAQVFIAGDTSPWANVKRKGDSLVVLKGGSTLKARFPSGQAVQIRLVNPDGGEATTTYARP